MSKLLKLFVVASTLAFVLMLFTVVSFAAQGGTCKVATEVLKLREEPSTSAKVLAKLTEGTQLTILDSKGIWYKVDYKGTIGWVSGEYVSISKEDTLQEGTVTTEVLNVRKEPSTESDKVTKLYKGDTVKLLDYSGSWYKIKTPEGETGWVCDDYIKVGSSSSEKVSVAKVTTEALNIRSGPDTTYDKIAKVYEDEKVIVLKNSGDWSNIETQDGTVGWVASEYISSKRETISRGAFSNLGSSLGQRVVRLAKKYLGYDYVWGAESPKSGFDCSGFVYYVLNHCGIEVKRTSAAELAKKGDYVKRSKLKPGDLVFFSRGSSYIDHVGIYIGDDQFIHAANPSKGVVITDLSEDYYSNSYETARRLL